MALENYYKSLFELRSKLIKEKIEFTMHSLTDVSCWEIELHDIPCKVFQYRVSNELFFTDEEKEFTKRNLSVDDALELIKDTIAEYNEEEVDTTGFKVCY